MVKIAVRSEDTLRCYNDLVETVLPKRDVSR